MVLLKEQEDELRLFLQSVEGRIAKLEQMKEKFAEKRDSIREEMQAHDFAMVPVKISVAECDDILEEIEKHLIELNKLKNYLSVKLKKVIEEEKMLEALKQKFGNSVEIEQADQGFEVVYRDEEAKQALEELKKSREKTMEIKNVLRKLEEHEQNSQINQQPQGQ